KAVPRGENSAATSEFCPEAHSENLGLVETFLPDRVGDVEANRTNRGSPRHSHTGAQANCRALFDLRLDASGLRQLLGCQDDIRRFYVVKCAKISKDPPAQPEFFGQSERHTQRD